MYFNLVYFCRSGFVVSLNFREFCCCINSSCHTHTHTHTHTALLSISVAY